MPSQASNLKDLFKIREYNRAKIDSINGILGYALGRKNGTGDPAILFFVDKKIKKKWMPSKDMIPSTLETNDGLFCPTDVINSSLTQFDSNKVVDLVTLKNTGQYGAINARALFGYRPLSHPSKYDLLDRLKGDAETITPGARIAFNDSADSPSWATLACFAKNSAGKPGFITNQHVGQKKGNKIYFPEMAGTYVGKVISTICSIPNKERFPGLLENSAGNYRIDASFVELAPGLSSNDSIDYRLPVLDEKNNIKMATLGEPYKLDLDTMGPIGMEVIGVGQTRSFQKGKIFAIAYCYAIKEKESADYLIIGEDGDDFSDPGDSGKLIVTADGKYQPIALLWGGWFEKRRQGFGQENWTYATDINVILDKLGLSILRYQG